MLKASLAVLHAQRPFIANRPDHWKSYRSGLRYRRRLYGEVLFWQGVEAFKSGRLTDAVRCLLVLLRYDPQDCFGPVYQRLIRRHTA